LPTEATHRTIGELVSTAAGDERDAIRHALLGLDVVLPDGAAPARFGGESMKDVAGYDTKRLFISSHGAFGDIASAIFKSASTPAALRMVRRLARVSRRRSST
jgi:glycolate oxidase